MVGFIKYYYHVQIVSVVLFSAFSIKDKKRQRKTDRLHHAALKKGPEDQGWDVKQEWRSSYIPGSRRPGRPWGKGSPLGMERVVISLMLITEVSLAY